MPEPLISLQGVHKVYEMPGGATGTVLEAIDLEVREGEILAILGPSGSGKSTLLRIIAGLAAPSRGTVRYRSGVVGQGVALVFQSFALFPWMTVQENVEIGLRAQGLTTKERERKALQVIDMIGLDGFEGAYPKELSGGMRQRVGFARSLVVDPDVLLMDEPFSALDVLTAENLRRDLLDLWIERRIPTKAIIIVTHSIEEAVYLADRAVILSRDPARIAAQVPITLQHWREREDHRFVQLVDQIYGLLTRRETHPAQQSGRRVQTVPPVRSGALSGLLELLEDQDERVDLYWLGEELSLDVEDFLPIVEAAELLGLAKVAEGDIELTEEGRNYADASLLRRKEIFRDQALERCPALQNMVHLLRQKSNGRMNREFFVDILERSVGADEAERQVDTLVDWGRYSELFAYDQESRQLYIETEAAEETAPTA
ncbi:MAG: nitrate/sulfonate/bicarbonate ABC transporter ATP-binding protein [Thermaerobacter sp.]|nr:nitrate/sulfonate/bicarbonate ABC transporter ATP-binding protein [Thermaerobacter sp.]